jgi:Uma2 family endonuclease
VDHGSEPELILRISPDLGGQSHETGSYFGGAPELIVEVSESNISRDLGIKLDMYRKVGVREYITVLLNPQKVIWRRLVRGAYKELEPEPNGWLKSKVFPGLWLDPKAI